MMKIVLVFTTICFLQSCIIENYYIRNEKNIDIDKKFYAGVSKNILQLSIDVEHLYCINGKDLAALMNDSVTYLVVQYNPNCTSNTCVPLRNYEKIKTATNGLQIIYIANDLNINVLKAERKNTFRSIFVYQDVSYYKTSNRIKLNNKFNIDLFSEMFYESSKFKIFTLIQNKKIVVNTNDINIIEKKLIDLK